MARLLAVSPHAETFQRALVALDFMVGWAGGHMPVDVCKAGEVDRLWHRTGVPDSGPRLARRVRALDERLSPEIRLGLPMTRPDSGGVSYATVLWAVVEGTRQVRFAAGFKPLPSLALRVGGSSRRYLIWALDERLFYFDVLRANRRLAYQFRAVQKRGDPDELRLPAPGCCLHEGRSRPVPVHVTRLSGQNFKARQVVGRLKDPPEVDLQAILAAR